MSMVVVVLVLVGLCFGSMVQFPTVKADYGKSCPTNQERRCVPNGCEEEPCCVNPSPNGAAGSNNRCAEPQLLPLVPDAKCPEGDPQGRCQCKQGYLRSHQTASYTPAAANVFNPCVLPETCAVTTKTTTPVTSTSLGITTPPTPASISTTTNTETTTQQTQASSTTIATSEETTQHPYPNPNPTSSSSSSSISTIVVDDEESDSVDGWQGVTQGMLVEDDVESSSSSSTVGLLSLVCKENETCAIGCESTCTKRCEYPASLVLPDEPGAKCLCTPGWYRNTANGRCVEKGDCPEVHTTR